MLPCPTAPTHRRHRNAADSATCAAGGLRCRLCHACRCAPSAARPLRTHLPDGTYQWIEKPKHRRRGRRPDSCIVIDPKAIEAARKDWCERCGRYRTSQVAMEVHHVSARGMAGGKRRDVSSNLICLCVGWETSCHRLVHLGRITVEELQAIVDAR